MKGVKSLVILKGFTPFFVLWILEKRLKRKAETIFKMKNSHVLPSL